jgi:hypothetical protein
VMPLEGEAREQRRRSLGRRLRRLRRGGRCHRRCADDVAGSCRGGEQAAALLNASATARGPYEPGD